MVASNKSNNCLIAEVFESSSGKMPLLIFLAYIFLVFSWRNKKSGFSQVLAILVLYFLCDFPRVTLMCSKNGSCTATGMGTSQTQNEHENCHNFT